MAPRLDEEPRKGLQRLEMGPTARWRSFALQLLAQKKVPSSAEPTQMTILEPWSHFNGPRTRDISR